MKNNLIRYVFPGAFKPPHLGHFIIAQECLKSENLLDVSILISPFNREGFSAEKSFKIWELFNKHLNNKLNIKICDTSPITEAYEIIKENQDDNFMMISGKSDLDRYKAITENKNNKYFNASVYNFPEIKGYNATTIRKLISEKKYKDIGIFIPEQINKETYINILL